MNENNLDNKLDVKLDNNEIQNDNSVKPQSSASDDIIKIEDVESDKYQQIKSLYDEFEKIEEQLGILIDDISLYGDIKNFKQFIENIKNKITEKREKLQSHFSHSQVEHSKMMEEEAKEEHHNHRHKGHEHRDEEGKELENEPKNSVNSEKNEKEDNGAIEDKLLKEVSSGTEEISSEINEFKKNNEFLKKEKTHEDGEKQESNAKKTSDEPVKNKCESNQEPKYEAMIEEEAKKIQISKTDDSVVNENIAKNNESIGLKVKDLNSEFVSKIDANLDPKSKIESARTTEITKDILGKSLEKSDEQKNVVKNDKEKTELKINETNFDVNLIKNSLKNSIISTNDSYAAKPDTTPKKPQEEAEKKIQEENKKYVENISFYTGIKK